MSLVVLGLSHHTAPLSLLESVSLGDPGRVDLAERIVGRENVSEAIVVSTCNRTEVYAEAHTFHGAVTDITDSLVDASGVDRDDLREHLYVHYEDRAIAHAFTVACGLDSMAVGEAQILGQMRTALRVAQRAGHAGPTLNSLFQQALRVGKRAHAETGIDSVSVSLVEAGLGVVERELGPMAQQRVLVVGAGGMSSLAATTVARFGCADLVITNRTASKAQRLAERIGGRARPLTELRDAVAEADVVISCTGSTGVVVDLALAGDAQVARGGRPQVYIDLALPHDVAPEVASLTGVTVAGLAALGEDLSAGETTPQVQEVADLVIAEVAAYLTTRAAESVAPTVAALRTRAAEVVDNELGRLGQRVPDMDDATRHEVQRAVHRIVEKLLHTPTVRMKERATSGHGDDYAQALRELFDLGPGETAAVSVPPRERGGMP
ncbi:glutamyl-tRNA reductase [Phycicoccus sp. SLBN-51]|uniref:glutamyl-tRNA reductase n=1 Tax=Phycicoccus sp. SLBN-51 TaxID=2768447 RepID=UPI00114EB6BD|nr:glutamyl-tRNA reductase [Phycicoccus sp. SLBN-51]TQJ49430.1 glutamyl-tRNA reductase [Phycicoccus sp. SLBN-51]